MGGCASILDSGRVTYELQVREDGSLAPVVDASMRVEHGQPYQSFEMETDSDGVGRVDFDIPPFAQSFGTHKPYWLRVTVRKEGFEPRVLELDWPDFVKQGSRFRRVESVLLHRGAP